jgi:hypothetical protein
MKNSISLKGTIRAGKISQCTASGIKLGLTSGGQTLSARLSTGKVLLVDEGYQRSGLSKLDRCDGPREGGSDNNDPPTFV